MKCAVFEAVDAVEARWREVLPYAPRAESLYLRRVDHGAFPLESELDVALVTLFETFARVSGIHPRSQSDLVNSRLGGFVHNLRVHIPCAAGTDSIGL